MDIYADQILDHYRNPRHAGSLAAPTIVHEEANLSCGDRVRLELSIENGTVRDVAWTGSGCAISQAGMSLLSDSIVGKPVEELGRLTKSDALALLGVPMSERRLKCGLLGLHTLLNTLRIQANLTPQSWTKTVADGPDA